MRQLWGFDECAVYNLPLQVHDGDLVQTHYKKTLLNFSRHGNNKEGKKEGNNKGLLL